MSGNKATLLALVVLCAACGATDPSPNPVPFAGTIFFHRNPGLSGQVLNHDTPLYLSGGQSEKMLPLDLSDCSGDPAEARWLLMGNFDVTRDGKTMYLECRDWVYRVSVPDGGKPEPILYGGSPGITGLTVSPDGRWIAFQRPVLGSETWIAESDGSGARRVIPGAEEAGVSPRAPIWLDNNRLLVPYYRATLEPTRHSWVYDLRAPDWAVTELKSLEDLAVSGLVYYGRSFSDELFLTWCPYHEPRVCYLRRFNSDGSGDEVLARIPFETAGHFAVSPDGRFLAARGSSLPGDFGSDIMVVRIEGAEVVGRISNGGKRGSELPVVWVAREY